MNRLSRNLNSIALVLLLYYVVISVQVVEAGNVGQTPFPSDFLKKTSLGEVKKIARANGYRIYRWGDGPEIFGKKLALPLDVVDELCRSNKIDEVDAALELLVEAKRGALRIASMIASSNTPELTKTLIIRHVKDGKFLEVITPLIQESVARGGSYDEVEPVSTYWTNLSKQKNPLAWLPLHRVNFEAKVYFPNYGAFGSGTGFDSNSVHTNIDQPPVPKVSGKHFETRPLSFDQSGAASCVQSWREHSNGKSEAKLFETASSLTAADISVRQLLLLKLECLAGAAPNDVKVEIVGADKIYGLLFGSASNGGAYPPGELGAYGRLYSWKSLAILTGAGSNASFDEVCSAVRNSQWCSITSTTKWFYNVAWDFGLVCIRPDKKHLAVLAATDTD